MPGGLPVEATYGLQDTQAGHVGGSAASRLDFLPVCAGAARLLQ
jgi:hypothetical protein